MNQPAPFCISKIENHQALIAAFGEWPSFNGAEIVSIRMERAGEDAPFLEAVIHHGLRDGTLDTRGRPTLRNEHLTTLRFGRAQIGYVSSFNHQNAIRDLLIELVSEPGSNMRFSVEIPSFFGCAIELECREIIVKSLVACQSSADA